MREVRAGDVNIGMVIRPPGEGEGRVVGWQVRNDEVLMELLVGREVVDVPALDIDDVVEVIDL